MADRSESTYRGCRITRRKNDETRERYGAVIEPLARFTPISIFTRLTRVLQAPRSRKDPS